MFPLNPFGKRHGLPAVVHELERADPRLGVVVGRAARARVALQVVGPGVADRADERVGRDRVARRRCAETRRPVSWALILGSVTRLEPGATIAPSPRRARARRCHVASSRRAVPASRSMKPEAPGPGCNWLPEAVGHLRVVRPGRLRRDIVAVDVLTGRVGQGAVGAVQRVRARILRPGRAEGRLVGRRRVERDVARSRLVVEAVAGREGRVRLVEGDVDQPAVLEGRRLFDQRYVVTQEQVGCVEPAGVVRRRDRLRVVGRKTGRRVVGRAVGD